MYRSMTSCQLWRITKQKAIDHCQSLNSFVSYKSGYLIGANRPTLGGTVPNLTAMSRCPALLTFYQFHCKCCATISAQLDICLVLVYL